MEPVGSLVPADFDAQALPESERRVLEAFVEATPAEWLLMPSLQLSDRGADREIDLLVICPGRGVLVLEVKGGLVDVDGERWTSYGRKIKNPVTQAMKAKHALLSYLTATEVGMSVFYLDHAVALPDVMCPEEGLGPQAPRSIVIDKFDLDRPVDAVARVLRKNDPVSPERVEAFVNALCPKHSLVTDHGQYFRAATAAMDQSTSDALAMARSMDANSRALVTGGAGTGKSWLVRDWAKRACSRGERTAVVCFNRPMADRLATQLQDSAAVVDTYHNLVVDLLAPFGFEIPTDPDPQWWETVPTDALQAHSAEVGTPFDTIIVDEAQDLRAHWLDSLRGLLDPEGPQRLLAVMDPAQDIYSGEWTNLVEFFRATLEVNLRNSRSLGELCAKLGGPTALQDNPSGPPPDFQRATGSKELRKQVTRCIDRLIENEGLSPSEIAVLTTHTSTRDALLGSVASKAPLVRWEDRDSTAVLCETIHRTKGLEWTAVIVAALDDPIDPQLLYIGASRPRMHLTLVGRDSLGGIAGTS